MTTRAHVAKLSLSITIAGAFTLLVVPILLFIITFSYRTNSRNLFAITRAYADRASGDTIGAVDALFDPVAAALRSAAELAAAEPDFFRREASRDYLHAALVSDEQIDALYVSWEDGYHRVVTRVDEVRRAHDPLIPSKARWHSSWMDAYAAGGTRRRHRIFFDEWPHVVARYDAAPSSDVRLMEQYTGAKATSALSMADPLINPDTGGPIISVGFPIRREGRFLGAVSANLTFGKLAEYLAAHRVSPNSVTLILDERGRVLAHPDLSKVVRPGDGEPSFADAASFSDRAIADAVRERRLQKSDRLLFLSGEPAKEYTAAFSPFPDSFGKKWEVLTVIPTDDFLSGLKASNRRLLSIMALLTAVALVLIFALSKRLAEPIDSLSNEMQQLRSLHFGAPRKRRSAIREVARMENAVELLQNSLKSFAAFVPVGVVRRLVSGGKPLTRSVESKRLTLLFTDLENFTTIAEKLPPGTLSEQLNDYFEQTTTAITGEGGTVDKFVGDAVMAFWGAPAAVEAPNLKACRAALRIGRRLQELNRRWVKEGKPPMNVRIGLHCGPALVGNIGSSDRLSYTAIGDTVNVAARLEDINKRYGTTICISEDVYQDVRKDVLARVLEKVKVKGREREITVYELHGLRVADDELDKDG